MGTRSAGFWKLVAGFLLAGRLCLSSASPRTSSSSKPRGRVGVSSAGFTSGNLTLGVPGTTRSSGARLILERQLTVERLTGFHGLQQTEGRWADRHRVVQTQGEQLFVQHILRGRCGLCCRHRRWPEVQEIQTGAPAFNHGLGGANRPRKCLEAFQNSTQFVTGSQNVICAKIEKVTIISFQMTG